MDGRIPLPALLSQVLVTFTIEFDNEFEHQVPHRTTNHGSTPGVLHAPWLVSRVMWSNFLRFIPEKGTTIAELRPLLGMPEKNMRNWLARLSQWWGYILVEPKLVTNSTRRLPPDTAIQPRSGGLKAIKVWRSLDAAIEKRWRERFGDDVIEQLRESLSAIVCQIEVELPQGLPILGYGMFSNLPEDPRPSPGNAVLRTLPLPSLLSQVLLWFAAEFEREAPVSLAISANVLRLLSEEGVRVSDLPRLAGVSKEAIATALSFLTKRGFAAGSRNIALTAKGRAAREKYHELLWAIEDRWQSSFGTETVANVRASLERPVCAHTAKLFLSLEPHPGNWRASMPKPEVLPHYPMVLHRGGFPDGS